MVMRTELLVLRELEWEMLPVTPFIFLNFYYRFFKRYGGFKRRCINEIIVQAQGGKRKLTYHMRLYFVNFDFSILLGEYIILIGFFSFYFAEHTFVDYYPTVIAIAALLAASKIAYGSLYREIIIPFTLDRVVSEVC